MRILSFLFSGATTRFSAQVIEGVAGLGCLAIDGYKKMLKRMILSPSSSFRHPAQWHRSDLGLYGRPGKIRVVSAFRNQIAAMLLFLRLFTALGRFTQLLGRARIRSFSSLLARVRSRRRTLGCRGAARQIDWPTCVGSTANDARRGSVERGLGLGTRAGCR